jgi:hypothetical protein
MVTAQDRSWSGTVRAGGTGLASGGPPEIHLGLGDIDKVDTLRVRWPDGELSEFESISTRQYLTITRTDP